MARHKETGLAQVQPVGAPPVPQQADSDGRLVELWLAGRPVTTARAYRSAVEKFTAYLGGKPLQVVTVGDLQGFVATLGDLAPASQARLLGAVKSLLSFGRRLGYFAFDVGAVVPLPKVKDTLAERLLTAGQVENLLAAAPGKRAGAATRNRVLLRFMFASAARVSEVVALRWADLKEREHGRGQVTIFGKGGKTRTVLLPASVWADLQTLRQPGASEDAPVFGSAGVGYAAGRKGQPLHPSQVLRIVRQAAAAAGIPGKVSPHWLRHAHATLSKAPLETRQHTLGHSSIATTSRYLHVMPDDSSALYLGL